MCVYLLKQCNDENKKPFPALYALKAVDNGSDSANKDVYLEHPCWFFVCGVAHFIQATFPCNLGTGGSSRKTFAN